MKTFAHCLWKAIVPASRKDIKQLHDDMGTIIHYDKLHEEWIENQIREIDEGKPSKTDTPTGCEKRQ